MMRYFTDPTSFPRSLPFWSPFLEYSGCILSFRFHFDWFWALLKQSPSSLTNCRSFLCLYFVFKVHYATLHVIFVSSTLSSLAHTAGFLTRRCTLLIYLRPLLHAYRIVYLLFPIYLHSLHTSVTHSRQIPCGSTFMS